MRARRRHVCAALALLASLLIALAAAGCGSDEELTSGVEGEYINAGKAVYQVQLTRLMNAGEQPDVDLLRGQAALPPKEQYLGVFLTIANDGKTAYLPPRDMKVVDTQGNQYLPLDTSTTGFGLNFSQPIPPGDSAPAPDSPASTGPQGGALVLFRVKDESVVDNLPLELDIPVAGAQQPSTVKLDV